MGENISQKVRDIILMQLSMSYLSLSSDIMQSDSSLSSESFDAEDIEKKFHESYAFVKFLGRGASAEVFLVRDRQSKKEYACRPSPRSSDRSCRE